MEKKKVLLSFLVWMMSDRITAYISSLLRSIAFFLLYNNLNWRLFLSSGTLHINPETNETFFSVIVVPSVKHCI